MIYKDTDIKELNEKLKSCFGFSVNQVLSGRYAVAPLRRLIVYYLFHFTNKTTENISTLLNIPQHRVISAIETARFDAERHKNFSEMIKRLKRA